MAKGVKRGGLGRGLDALFADAAPIIRSDSEVKETEGAYQSSTGGENQSAAAEASNQQASAVSTGAPGTRDPSGDTAPFGKSSGSGNTSGSGKSSGTGNTRDSGNTIGSGNTGDTLRSGSSNNSDNKENAYAGDSAEAYDDRILYVDINDIMPNPDQPRKTFDPGKLAELATSIRENGVIQPIVVRKAENGYVIVAGERRWRAARLADLKSVPCIVREFDEKQNLIVAILENMQREDLDPIEEAEGLSQMAERFGFTQEQISKSVGKSRAYIANSIRLLKLPESIREMVRKGEISAAHGRTLITLENSRQQQAAADRIVREGLSVRATEKLTEQMKKGVAKAKKPEERNPEIETVEEELRAILGTRVTISDRKKNGKIELEYYSRDELNRLIDLLRSLER